MNLLVFVVDECFEYFIYLFARFGVRMTASQGSEFFTSLISLPSAVVRECH